MEGIRGLKKIETPTPKISQSVRRRWPVPTCRASTCAVDRTTRAQESKTAAHNKWRYLWAIRRKCWRTTYHFYYCINTWIMDTIVFGRTVGGGGYPSCECARHKIICVPARRRDHDDIIACYIIIITSNVSRVQYVLSELRLLSCISDARVLVGPREEWCYTSAARTRSPGTTLS